MRYILSKRMTASNKPSLILLNGPLGIGKSTLATMYSERHPLALNLDIDLIRGSLGQWRERRVESAKLAWEMTHQMGRVALTARSDVIVAHAIRRPEHFRHLEELAAETGAKLYEILLLAPKDEAIRRFIARGQASGFELGYRPDGLVGRLGGIPWVEAIYDGVVAATKSRTETIIINPLYGSPEETYQEMLTAIAKTKL